MRPDRAIIKPEWINPAVQSPVREVIQQDGRIRRWVSVPEAEGKYLRVVLLPDGENGAQRVLRSRVQTMRIRYFTDTDTLLIEFKDRPVAETRDLDENTILDVDANANICSITVEHASQRTDIPQFSYEQVTA